MRTFEERFTTREQHYEHLGVGQVPFTVINDTYAGTYCTCSLLKTQLVMIGIMNCVEAGEYVPEKYTYYVQAKLEKIFTKTSLWEKARRQILKELGMTNISTKSRKLINKLAIEMYFKDTSEA